MEMNPLGPYIAGSPLRTARGFFGRQDTLQRVVHSLHHPDIKMLLFYGQRGIGKTSFLYQLQQTLHVNGFLAVYADLRKLLTSSVGEMLQELASQIRDACDLDLPDSHIFDDQGLFFRRTFLPEVEKKLGAERRLVFLLDEVHMLESESAQPTAAKAFLPLLYSLLNPMPNQQSAFVLMMGRGEQEFSGDLMSILKDAAMREILWVLSAESAEQLIRQGELGGILQFTDQAVAHILSLTSGHPYLMQLLCSKLWQRAFERGAKPTMPHLIDMPDVDLIIPDALTHGKEKLEWWWNGLSSSEKIYAAAIAEMSAENKWIAKETIMQELSRIGLQLQEIELAARTLVKRQVLTVTEKQEYHFSIELFHRWVHRETLLQYELSQLSSIKSSSNLAQIRQTLNLAFDDSRLSAFCLDYFEEVYDQFSDGMRKDYKITLLLDYCRRRPPDLDRLQELVRKEYETK